MGSIFQIESVAQIHKLLGYEKPKHPLITVIEPAKIKLDFSLMNQQIISSLYSISLKNGHECKLKYGRQTYDFQEGSLMFLAPDQMIEPIGESENIKDSNWDGWVLLFHPDLIRRSSLAVKMKEYSFFSYEAHEALHVSEQERQTITNLVETIKHEYSQNLDSYSQELILTNIELLLNYCKRYYGRQFITRSHVSKDVVIRFEDYLQTYFNDPELEHNGMPSVKQCAEKMGYSRNYLSDLLKKETGKNTQDHIYFHLIEKAKNMLLGTEEPVNRIAYSLGFEYPQHFSKLFKNKTGKSPAEYRN